MTLREFLKKAGRAVWVEAAKCGSAEELREFFVSRGVSVNEGEAETLYAQLFGKKVTELSEEELDGVAGGLLFPRLYYPIEGCPRGHTKRYVVFPHLEPEKGIVDSACSACDYSDGDHINGDYCTKQKDYLKWE